MFQPIPIVENRIAQFAARFERHGADWVYYGDRLTGGLPISDAEHETLLAEYARRLRRAERVMRWWMPVAIILCVAWQLRFRQGDPPRFLTFAPVLLLPLPWVYREWWRADRLATELAGRRFPVTKPRTWQQGARSRLAALPTSIGVMLLLACAVLAFQSRPWATDEQRLWLAEAVLGMAGGAWLLWMKRAPR
jgi:hypothetical protein